MARVRSGTDPFQKMLVWSAVVHFLLFSAMGLAMKLRPAPNMLPIPMDGIVVSLGDSGPMSGGGGSAAPTRAPEPEPEPEPEPKKEPTVVRPTVEQREQLPLPDAAPKKPSRFEKPKQDSGLRGADAASAESAPLKKQPSLGGLSVGVASGGGGSGGHFEYAYYVQQMLNRIHQHWQRAVVRGEFITIVEVTIARNGSLQNVQVAQSSGVPTLDRAAQRAVLLSDPMPPLPNSYSNDQVVVRFRFNYSDKN